MERMTIILDGNPIELHMQSLTDAMNAYDMVCEFIPNPPTTIETIDTLTNY